MTRNKIRFIRNWATLVPGVRAMAPGQSVSPSACGPFVVGLSGNLGFTHDPVIVFEAARLLRDSKDIHFLLGLGDQVRKVEGNASRGQASKRHPGRSRRGRTVRGRFF
jgi:colanic acid biosynthesis glycosyl transferase WcaI